MMVLSGLFEPQWWAYPVVALGLTHATIAAVTIYLHRAAWPSYPILNPGSIYFPAQNGRS